MTSLPSVTLIILNWNGREYLADCLNALFDLDYPDFTVCLVDNNSTDNSLAIVEGQFPQVTIYRNATNAGFSAGNNTALRQVESDFAVLVNLDVIVNREWLRQIIVPMLADSTIGIAGCKLYYPESNLIQHAGGFLRDPQAFPGHFGWQEVDEGQHDVLRDVTYVIGAAMAIRRTTLERVGYLDDGFFLFYEDVDFCFRARQAGYRIVYVPEATAVHIESVKTQKESDFYLQNIYTSRWRFLLKHYAVVDLLTKTVPAEQKWLAELPPRHRFAAAHAYRTTRQRLQEIARVRGKDINKAWSQSDFQDIANALKLLHQLAWQPVNPLLDRVKKRQLIEERPFTSSTPFIGSFFASFRRWWNAIATKQYVHPLMEQQNEFNQQVAAHFPTRKNQLQTLGSTHTKQVGEIVTLTQQIDQLYRQIRAIDDRLARLESKEGKPK